MNWKKIGRALLFPHPAVVLLLLPGSICALTWAMTGLEETDPVRIGSYVLAFYTLCVCCLWLPRLVRSWRGFLRNDPHARRWLGDPQLRMNVTLTGNVVWNGAYAAFQLGLGWYHRDWWLGFLGLYHLCLALVRLILVHYGRSHILGERMDRELRRYRVCGWSLLLLNLALAARMLFMIRYDRLVAHHPITSIAMATYTFTSLTMAMVNVIRYRRYRSPVLSASKVISLASGLVSLLSLEGTMLVSFGGETTTPLTRQLFLSLSGGGVSAIILVMAGYMVKNANRQLKAGAMRYE